MKKLNKQLKKVISDLLDQINYTEDAGDILALSVAVFNLRNALIIEEDEYL